MAQNWLKPGKHTTNLHDPNNDIVTAKVTWKLNIFFNSIKIEKIQSNNQKCNKIKIISIYFFISYAFSVTFVRHIINIEDRNS